MTLTQVHNSEDQDFITTVNFGLVKLFSITERNGKRPNLDRKEKAMGQTSVRPQGQDQERHIFDDIEFQFNENAR